MRYLIQPSDLVFRAKGYIAGFSDMCRDEEIPQWDLYETATEVAQEWTDDWDTDQGFGSSDGTYMLKDFIDRIIYCFTDKSYKTEFIPRLSVVKF